VAPFIERTLGPRVFEVVSERSRIGRESVWQRRSRRSARIATVRWPPRAGARV